MESLHGKSVFVVTNDGQAVSIGKFFVEGETQPNYPQRVELAFETKVLACRIRIPQHKVAAIKGTWNGLAYRYTLPAGDAAWRGDSQPLPNVQGGPTLETFPVPLRPGPPAAD